MADQHVEVKTEGCFSRLMGSIKNAVFGALLVLVAIGLIFGNEWNASRQAAALEDAGKSVVEAVADRVDAATEGKLVHLSGQATAAGNVADPVFGISVPAIRLERSVEMYQWKEVEDRQEQRNVGGSATTTTTTSYKKDWSSSLISSSSFKEAADHQNPTSMPYRAESFAAPAVTVGAFTLSAGLVNQIPTENYVPDNAAVAALAGRAVRTDQGLYIGVNNLAGPGNPQIGDVRVTFKIARPQPVSVLARQSGSSLAAWESANGRSIEILQAGTVAAAAMVETAKSGNTALAWGLRFLAWILLFAAFATILKPLVVIADVIPFIGSMLRGGVTLISLVISVPLAVVLIIVAKLLFLVF